MPTWVPVLTTIACTLLTIVLNFYWRFVPDVEVQKRHIKRLVHWLLKFGFWATHLANFALQIYFLHSEAQAAPPITTTQVITISLMVGLGVLNVVLILFGFSARLLGLQANSPGGGILGVLGGVIDSQGLQLEANRRHSDMERRQIEALLLIAGRLNLEEEVFRTLSEGAKDGNGTA